MEQYVRVRQTYPDGTAQVVHVRESACSGDCHKCSGCGAAKETILLKAQNPIGAEAGSLVTIQSATGPVLKAAVVLYVIPLALFFVGYLLGALAWNAGALAGCLGFVLGVVFVVAYDRKLGKQAETIYTITGYVGDSLLKSAEKGDNHHG